LLAFFGRQTVACDMGLQMFDDDLIEKAIHGAANGCDQMEDFGAIRIAAKRALYCANLARDALDSPE
jgi:hypothetical protein|tara:strand:- start:200 stop:400 length:201 start_codon:yes stop_codon:yes gene_type:complete